MHKILNALRTPMCLLAIVFVVCCAVTASAQTVALNAQLVPRALSRDDLSAAGLPSTLELSSGFGQSGNSGIADRQCYLGADCRSVQFQSRARRQPARNQDAHLRTLRPIDAASRRAQAAATRRRRSLHSDRDYYHRRERSSQPDVVCEREHVCRCNCLRTLPQHRTGEHTMVGCSDVAENSARRDLQRQSQRR